MRPGTNLALENVSGDPAPGLDGPRSRRMTRQTMAPPPPKKKPAGTMRPALNRAGAKRPPAGVTAGPALSAAATANLDSTPAPPHVATAPAAPAQQGARPAAAHNLLDELRAEIDDKSPSAGVVRDTLPWPVLIAVFGAVIVFVAVLMWPQWRTDMASFRRTRAFNTRNYADAIPPLMSLIQKKQDDITPLSELGLAYLHLKNYDESVKYFTRAQAAVGGYAATDDDGKARAVPDFNFRLAQAYMGTGDRAKAKVHALAALKLDKTNAEATFVLGRVAFEEGDFRRATEYLKVVARKPGYDKLVADYYKQIEDKLFAGIEG